MAKPVGAWGSVRQLKTGFQARLPKFTSPDGNRRPIGVFTTKAEAYRQLRRAEAAWDAREAIPGRLSVSAMREAARKAGVPTLSVACTDYIAVAKTNGWMFTRYADTNRSLVKRLIQPLPVGNEYVTMISKAQIRDLLDEILNKGLSRSQALQTKALLSQVFRWLIETEVVMGLTESPVEGVKIRSRGKGAGVQTARREPFLPVSVEALGAIANVVNAYPDLKHNHGRYSMTATEFKALIRTLLFGGLRPEEVLSLTAESVHPDGVWVAEVLVRDLEAGEWVKEPPKSGGVGHLVPLPPVTLAMLNDLRISRGTGLLWPTRKRGSDDPTRAHDVPTRPWGRVREAAGMGPDPKRKEVSWRTGLQVKDLRATCASMLAAIGVTLPEARAHLGHAADGATTSKHYLRALEIPQLRELATTVNGGIAARLKAAEEVIDTAFQASTPPVCGQAVGTDIHSVARDDDLPTL